MQLCSLLIALAFGGSEPNAQPPVERWDERSAEHLLNRAGFGADAREIARAVELGRERAVAALFAVDPWLEEPFYARIKADRERMGSSELLEGAAREERRERERMQREDDKQQAADYLEWWIERMLAGENALAERMTLFWHGHFTSSFQDVKSSYEMIRQNQLFRRHALGSFRELLHGIARDPAMLVYLDNATNRKGKPNENFARELLELFTLGVGHYSEEDVREVARAFTGWGVKSGRFRFDAGRHDRDAKRVLGVEGDLDGDDVLEILLNQEACARHLVRKLVAYFEGVEPSSERVERYAVLLRESDYEIAPLLQALFLDPAFYREDVLGTRVASPIDFLVGTVRRLGARPEGRLVRAGAALLGEKLFYPPSVKGWDGGRSWIFACSPELPGQMAGILLGRVRAKDLARAWRPEFDAEDAGDAPGTYAPGDEAEAADGGARAPQPSEAKKRKLPSELRALAHVSARPRLNLTQRVCQRLDVDAVGAASDAAVAGALLETLLATPAAPELAQLMGERVARRRVELEIPERDWLAQDELAEPLLREVAYEILSLPEARLH